MSEKCRQCGNEHLIKKDYMIICDDCLSTIVLNKDGSVFAEHLTNDSFKKSYSESKDSLRLNDENTTSTCKSLISKQGNIPSILNLLGTRYIQEERFGDAIKVLKQAVDLNPLYITACCNLAIAYHRFGYNELAVKYYEEARKNVDSKDDRYVEIMSGCAIALAETGRLVKAEDYLEKAEAQGFTHGDDVRLTIGTKKIEAEEIPGTNRSMGNRSNSQTNTNTPNNQRRQNGASQPVWPYIAGLVFLGLIVLSGEVNILGCFVIGIIIYVLGSRVSRILKNNADRSSNRNNNSDQ